MSRRVKTMRYKVTRPEGLNWDEFRKRYKEIESRAYSAKNYIACMLWEQRNPHHSFKYRFRKKIKDQIDYKEIAGKSMKADVSGFIKREIGVVTRDVVDGCYAEVNSAFSGERGKDIFAGKSTLPTYKSDTSIPVRAKALKIEKTPGGKYVISATVFDRDYAKKEGISNKLSVLIKAKGQGKSVIDKIYSGEYKLLDSSLKRKDRDYYVHITYEYPEPETSARRIELSPDRVMGIDLGVVNAAVIAYNFTGDRFYFDGSEIRSFRARVEARRRQLQRQYKFAGSRRGHGRVTALKPIEKLRNKAANFRDTLNHRYSKKIVDLAVKHGCGVIQIEDLSGIHADDRFLKSWPYHDMQEKITYKAEAAGIEVRKIDPRYTSIRCSACGHIAEGNRKTQADFECILCGYKTNADYNAARNIATPGIADIIKRKLDEIDTKMMLAEGS